VCRRSWNDRGTIVDLGTVLEQSWNDCSPWNGLVIHVMRDEKLGNNQANSLTLFECTEHSSSTSHSEKFGSYVLAGGG
jgi:hypothetical protein